MERERLYWGFNFYFGWDCQRKLRMNTLSDIHTKIWNTRAVTCDRYASVLYDETMTILFGYFLTTPVVSVWGQECLGCRIFPIAKRAQLGPCVDFAVDSINGKSVGLAIIFRMSTVVSVRLIQVVGRNIRGIHICCRYTLIGLSRRLMIVGFLAEVF